MLIFANVTLTKCKISKNWKINTSGKNISFHKFPNDENLQKLWIDAGAAENINIKYGKS